MLISTLIFFAGDKALKAEGEHNTSNQFEVIAKNNKVEEKLRKVV